MVYSITYTDYNGGKPMKETIELNVPDTNMDDTPLLLTAFAQEICKTDIVVTNVKCAEEE